MTGPPLDMEERNLLEKLLVDADQLIASAYAAQDARHQTGRWDTLQLARVRIASAIAIVTGASPPLAPMATIIAAAQQVVDECRQGSSGHGAPSLDTIERLRAALAEVHR